MTQKTLEKALHLKTRIDNIQEERSKMQRMVQAIKSKPEYIVYMDHHLYGDSKDSLGLDCRWNKDLAQFLEDKMHILYIDMERLKVELETL